MLNFLCGLSEIQSQLGDPYWAWRQEMGWEPGPGFQPVWCWAEALLPSLALQAALPSHKFLKSPETQPAFLSFPGATS